MCFPIALINARSSCRHQAQKVWLLRQASSWYNPPPRPFPEPSRWFPAFLLPPEQRCLRTQGQEVSSVASSCDLTRRSLGLRIWLQKRTFVLQCSSLLFFAVRLCVVPVQLLLQDDRVKVARTHLEVWLSSLSRLFWETTIWRSLRLIALAQQPTCSYMEDVVETQIEYIASASKGSQDRPIVNRRTISDVSFGDGKRYQNPGQLRCVSIHLVHSF